MDKEDCSTEENSSCEVFIQNFSRSEKSDKDSTNSSLERTNGTGNIRNWQQEKGENSNDEELDKEYFICNLDTLTSTCCPMKCMGRTCMAVVSVGFLVSLGLLVVTVTTYAAQDGDTEESGVDLIYQYFQEEEEIPKNLVMFKGSQFVQGLQTPNDWNNFQRNIANIKTSLKIKVLHGQVNDGPATQNLEENSIEILGRPEFCTESKKYFHNTVEALRFENVSFLHLSSMDNCHFYVNLILSRWNFPKVRHLKLERMLIREKEFRELTNFIDKYNETLYHVEIEESYLCPSPVCDAGMINFPEHDFRLSIKRRRETPNWV